MSRTSYATVAVAAVALAVVVAAFASGGLRAKLRPAGAGSVRGSVVLGPDGAGTRYAVRLAGVEPGVRARVTLHAGTPGRPSASFVALPTPAAPAGGPVQAEGAVLFRGTERVALRTLADEPHAILVSVGDRVVARGALK